MNSLAAPSKISPNLTLRVVDAVSESAEAVGTYFISQEVPTVHEADRYLYIVLYKGLCEV